MAHFRQIFCIFYIATCAKSLAIPVAIKQVNKRTVETDNLKEQLIAMMNVVDGALNDYIERELDCTTVQACRVATTSLELSNLPHYTDIQSNTPNWNEVFTKNMNGLQDFNYFLQNLFLTHRRLVVTTDGSVIVDGEILRTIANQLRDVAILLTQFMLSFEANMEGTFCLNLDIKPLSSYPPCSICAQPALPSDKLEVVRNYQFLMQFYEFLGDFLNLYNKFLFMTPVPEQCN